MPAVRIEADQALRARILRMLASNEGITQLLRELDDICQPDRDAVYEALSLIDQRYRLGRIEEHTYRRLKTRASDIALGRVPAANSPSATLSVPPPRAVAIAMPAAVVAPPAPAAIATSSPAAAEATPLRELLAALPGRRLPLALTLAVARDIGHAVASLRAQRLDCAGIGIDRVFISDTGAAELDAAGVVGAGPAADPQADLQALAALTYELLTGLHPFKGLAAAEARQLGLRPRRPPGLNRPQWHLLERALVGEPRGHAAEPMTWVRKLVRNRAARRLPAPADFRSIPAGRRWSWRGIWNWH